MKEFILILIISILLIGNIVFVSSTKIATFNIQSGIGTIKQEKRLFDGLKYILPHSNKYIKQIPDFINNEGINIIAFQETELGSLRSLFVNQAGLIAKNTNLKYAAYEPNYKIAGFVSMGNAVLSEYPIAEKKNYFLYTKSKVKKRSALLAKINSENLTLNFITTHLSTNKYERDIELKELADIVNNLEGAVLLAGDFNVDVKSNEIKNFLASTNLTYKEFDCKTYPSWNPKRCIDMIFAKNIEIKNIYVPNIKLSDHLPLIIEV